MGNWRTVNIIGTIGEKDVKTLRALLNVNSLAWPISEICGADSPATITWDKYECLTYDSEHPGLCSLANWPAENVDAVGNLSERDYSVQDVFDALKFLCEFCPTMMLTVHCGGERESLECVATIKCGEGLVRKYPPEIKTLRDIPSGQVSSHLLKNLYG